MILKEDLEKMYWGEGKSMRDIAKMYGVSYPTIRYWMKKYSIPWRERNEAMVKKLGKEFDRSNTLKLSYILGVLLGDGYVYKGKNPYVRLNIAIYDIDFANQFKSALIEIGLNPCQCIIKPIKEAYSPQICILAHSRPFVDWFKSLNLEDIRKIVEIDKEHMIAFIRGFYESEGCVKVLKHKDKKSSYVWKGLQIDMSNTSLELIKLVNDLLEKIGLNFKLVTAKNWNGKKLYYLQCWKQKEVKRFLEVINPVIKRKPRILYGEI